MAPAVNENTMPKRLPAGGLPPPITHGVGPMAVGVAAAIRSGDPRLQEDAVQRFGFAVPTVAALDAISACSPGGVVEIGAGTGYWAAQLAHRGVDVLAVDLHPPPDLDNPWFAGSPTWFPVESGDERVAGEQPSRCLLLVWPTKNEMWPADALALHHRAGGRHAVYVGEPAGGRTGDAVLHALIGEAGNCVACTYGITDSPCTCDVQPLWRGVARIGLPAWQADDVGLHVLERVEATSGRWVRRGRKRRREPPVR